MVTLILQIIDTLKRLSDLPLLALRLIVAYGFYQPAIVKLKNVGALIEWFGKMGIPAPTLNAYMSLITETTGVLCLIVGFATRLITIPMMVIMAVAIVTVHWKNGFSCGHNGFQIPFYFGIMLFTLLVYGPGRFSLDDYIRR